MKCDEMVPHCTKYFMIVCSQAALMGGFLQQGCTVRVCMGVSIRMSDGEWSSYCMLLLPASMMPGWVNPPPLPPLPLATT